MDGSAGREREGKAEEEGEEEEEDEKHALCYANLVLFSRTYIFYSDILLRSCILILLSLHSEL